MIGALNIDKSLPTPIDIQNVVLNSRYEESAQAAYAGVEVGNQYIDDRSAGTLTLISCQHMEFGRSCCKNTALCRSLEIDFSAERVPKETYC